jgi:formylglycine-generating enzyme
MRAPSTAACALLVFACGDQPPDGPDATVEENAPAIVAQNPRDASTPRSVEGAAMGATMRLEPAGARASGETVGELTDGEVSGDAPADGEASGASTDGEASGASTDGEASGAGSPCPEDMVAVDTSFCPDIERRCLDMEHEGINNIDICHAFAHQQRCRVEPRRIAFCIDRYEYPNRSGAHPTWMLDWYKAQATCESKGKRLCYASEWTAACEGPDHTPFPYGWDRDHDKCNIDNFFIEPKKRGKNGSFLFYSKDPKIALDELSRLDQSVASGALEACASGYGVHDMTGNVDEWVVSDVAPREKSLWAGLKGGAWGHVRSQCRPMTYSHDPGFSYYFVGFRCCRDADDAPAWTPAPQAMPPPVVEPHDYAPEPVLVTTASGPSKTKFTRTGHTE